MKKYLIKSLSLILLFFCILNAFSQNTRKLESVKKDSIKTQQPELYFYTGQSDFTSNIEWSPDGKFLATYSHRNAKIWDIEERKQIKTCRPDEFYIWDVDFGLQIRKIKEFKDFSANYSPNKKYAVFSYSDSDNYEHYITCMWDILNDKELYKIEENNTFFGWISDSLYLSKSGTLKILSAESGKIIQTIKTDSTKNLTNVSISPKSTYAIISYRENLDIVDIETEKITQTIKIDSAKEIRDYEFIWSPDERFVCFDTYDSRDYFHIYDLEKQTENKYPLKQLKISYTPWPKMFSPDSKYLIFRYGFEGDNSYAFFDIKKEEVLDYSKIQEPIDWDKLDKDFHFFADSIWNLTFSPDGKCVAFFRSGGDLCIAKYSGERNSLYPLYDAYNLCNIPNIKYEPLGFTNDKNLVAIHSSEEFCNLKYWDIHTGKVTTPLKSKMYYHWSEDSNYVLGQDENGNFIIWDVFKNEEICNGVEKDFVKNIPHWSPNSKYIYWTNYNGNDEYINIFDISKRKFIYNFQIGCHISPEWGSKGDYIFF